MKMLQKNELKSQTISAFFQGITGITIVMIIGWLFI